MIQRQADGFQKLFLILDLAVISITSSLWCSGSMLSVIVYPLLIIIICAVPVSVSRPGSFNFIVIENLSSPERGKKR